MIRFAAEEYQECKIWIAQKKEEGYSWNDIKKLCTNDEMFEEEFYRLQEDEMIIPPTMNPEDWIALVVEIEENHIPIVDMFGGISADGATNTLPVPIGGSSAWNNYKNHLLGRNDGKPKMSEEAVTMVEKNCHWLLNHLKRETRDVGPVKGLVMGSVQSGKTANMIGLVSMAADYDWNFFIIMSGSIDNLRKQTRDRFCTDLMQSQGVNWKVLDYTSHPDFLIDIKSQQRYLACDMKLNNLGNNNWGERYVTVCLKNSTRLERLINWLHSDPIRAAKLRVLIIDDEADQAGINTAKMSEDLTEEDVIERTAINQYLVNLANGKNADGTDTNAPFQAMNYVSFTATPYANVLNEAFEESLYPKDFICSLPESNEYFGAKVIFGSCSDDSFPGLNIVRTVPENETKELKSIHKGMAYTLPEQFKKSVCWFLCSAAILRSRGYKKPISMLVHTTAMQRSHFEEYDILKNWLIRSNSTGEVISLCESVYAEEKDEFTLEDLRNSYPKYGRIGEVNGDFPSFEEIKNEIELLLSHIENIMMAEDRSTEYHKDAIHLCVDNCGANKHAEEGTYLRVVYPSSEQLATMDKAPVFIVLGGNTLARGLTLEGLVCTYFARNANQADTLMQMGRWFGYRKGYELLQRIWMPEALQEKFNMLEKIDEKLKEELQDYMDKGKSPSQFGPHIVNSATIKRFMITAKNRRQNALECDFDFSGDSYETTKFDENQETLSKNIEVTENFLFELGEALQSKVAGSAFVWHNIDFQHIKNNFFDKFILSEHSSLFVDLPIFFNWMDEMNKDGKYLKWNVAIAGDKGSEKQWKVKEYGVGTIERSRKKDKSCVDIGSLRSGRDAICDVIPEELSPEQKAAFDTTRKNGKNIISARSKFGLEDRPLLLLYRIDKNRGKESKLRCKIGTKNDVIGFSIVVSGEGTGGGSHAKTLTVRIPND